METTVISWYYIRIFEHKMETTIIEWVYTVIMENRMEITEYILVLYRDNGT